MQNFIQISLGVSVLRMRDLRPSAQSDSAIFWGGFLRKATAETRAPILTQNTSNDVVLCKEVPFGGRETRIYGFDPHFPPKPPFLGPISDLEFFSPKTALTLDG